MASWVTLRPYGRTGSPSPRSFMCKSRGSCKRIPRPFLLHATRIHATRIHATRSEPGNPRFGADFALGAGCGRSLVTTGDITRELGVSPRRVNGNIGDATGFSRPVHLTGSGKGKGAVRKWDREEAMTWSEVFAVYANGFDASYLRPETHSDLIGDRVLRCPSEYCCGQTTSLSATAPPLRDPETATPVEQPKVR